MIAVRRDGLYACVCLTAFCSDVDSGLGFFFSSLAGAGAGTEFRLP